MTGPIFSIDFEIKSLLPELRLGVIKGLISVSQSPPELLNHVYKETARIKDGLPLNKIHSIEAIDSTRKAYKTLGKEPSRYRPSAEALHRRIIQGKEMYFINCVVDIINLVSLKTGFSIGGYNASEIEGEVMLKKGGSDNIYNAIGRGNLNIEYLPVLVDAIGPFGSPTSDSERTKITDSTKEILLCIFDFESNAALTRAQKSFVELLTKYADATELNTFIID